MLLNTIYRAFKTALEAGHIVFTESVGHQLVEPALRSNYEVRVAPSLAKKPTRDDDDDKPKKEKRDPFLPCDPDTLITDHKNYNLLFNKFPVIEHHVLLTTKDFQSQLDPLKFDDFEAIAWFLHSVDYKYLMFYNSGNLSGASQAHKHMQGVPIAEDFPFQDLIARHKGQQDLVRIPELPFLHYLHYFPTPLSSTPADAAQQDAAVSVNADLLFQAYQSLHGRMRSDIHPPFPHNLDMICYNMLCTSDWLMLVPRTNEKYDGSISVNSVGFVGCMLVTSEAHLQKVRQAGVVRVLQSLGFPAADDSASPELPSAKARAEKRLAVMPLTLANGDNIGILSERDLRIITEQLPDLRPDEVRSRLKSASISSLSQFKLAHLKAIARYLKAAPHYAGIDVSLNKGPLVERLHYVLTGDVPAKMPRRSGGFGESDAAHYGEMPDFGETAVHVGGRRIVSGRKSTGGKPRRLDAAAHYVASPYRQSMSPADLPPLVPQAVPGGAAGLAPATAAIPGLTLTAGVVASTAIRPSTPPLLPPGLSPEINGHAGRLPSAHTVVNGGGSSGTAAAVPPITTPLLARPRQSAQAGTVVSAAARIAAALPAGHRSAMLAASVSPVIKPASSALPPVLANALARQSDQYFSVHTTLYAERMGDAKLKKFEFKVPHDLGELVFGLRKDEHKYVLQLLLVNADTLAPVLPGCILNVTINDRTIDIPKKYVYRPHIAAFLDLLPHVYRDTYFPNEMTVQLADKMPSAVVAVQVATLRDLTPLVHGVYRYTLGKEGPLADLEKAAAELDKLPDHINVHHHNANAGNDDDDFQIVGDETASLLDPISLLRMQHPGREHRQNFLTVMVERPTPQCLICNDELRSYEELRICPFTKARVQDSSIDEIVYGANGWRGTKAAEDGEPGGASGDGEEPAAYGNSTAAATATLPSASSSRKVTEVIEIDDDD
ncbi:bifunctional AP-4-A phosphorylase/ADP sulfurylase [Sorochytrium milnesiophthora]